MTQRPSANIGALLRELLTETPGTDLAKVRAERYAELSSRRRKNLDDTFEALDALLSEMEQQVRAIQVAVPQDAAEAEAPASEPQREEETMRPSDETDSAISIDESMAAAPTETAAPGVAVAALMGRVGVGPDHLDAEPTAGWERGAELLFDDALRLFRLGDSEGALISLERLLASVDLNDDLHEFVKVNQERLMGVYEVIIGPWEKVPVRVNGDEELPACFFEPRKIEQVLSKVDGIASLGEIMETSGLSGLEAVSVLSQLVRAKAVSTEATTH